MQDTKTEINLTTVAKNYFPSLRPDNISVLPRDLSREPVIGIYTGEEKLTPYLIGQDNHIKRLGTVTDSETGEQFHHVAIINNSVSDQRRDLYIPDLLDKSTGVINLNGQIDVLVPIVLQEGDHLVWSQLNIPLATGKEWTNHRLFVDLLDLPSTFSTDFVYGLMGDWMNVSRGNKYNILPGMYPDVRLPNTEEGWTAAQLEGFVRVMAEPENRQAVEALKSVREPSHHTGKFHRIKEGEPKNPKKERKEGKKIDTVGASFTGKRHIEEAGVNEDSNYSIIDYVRDNPELKTKIWQNLTDRGLVYLVADGVGGHAGGYDASVMATRIFFEYYYKEGLSLEDALQKTNQDVYHHQISNPNLFGMSTTFAGVRVNIGNSRDSFQVDTFNAGDSPIFGFGDGQIQALSVEDSLVNAMLQRGLISEADAANHPQANVITVSVGSKLRLDSHIFQNSFVIDSGHYVAQYTDGVDDVIAPGEVAAEYAKTPDDPRGAERRIARACSQSPKKGDDATINIIDLDTILGTLATLAP